MRATIYLEGGATGPYSKDLQRRCREGFSKLFQGCGFQGRLPRLVASGGRASAFDDFKRAHKNKRAEDYVALLIDSEDPVGDLEATWQHLAARDSWERPPGAEDDQVLFMTTCMETWIISDRGTLKEYYGGKLQESRLPPKEGIEERNRHEVQERLSHATRHCSDPYSKGKHSYKILSKLKPAVLNQHLASFARTVRILDDKL